MTRLLVLVEGQTEETFVGELLRPFLCSNGFTSVEARLMGNARQRDKRGGVRDWDSAKGDIVRHLKQDARIVVTTMVDYYGMPHGTSNRRAWPGRATAPAVPLPQRADHVETALAANIAAEMGGAWNSRRFVPFVMIHEFEALLFSDCKKFAASLYQPTLASEFLKIRKKFSSPEEINDSPKTHPAQRILDLFEEYQKPVHGNLAAAEVGLDSMKAECLHFAGWLDRLVNLAESPPTAGKAKKKGTGGRSRTT